MSARRLSTVHQSADELGSTAARAVLAQLDGQTFTAPILLESPVVWRESA